MVNPYGALHLELVDSIILIYYGAGLPSDIKSRYENHLLTRHPIGFCFGAIPAADRLSDLKKKRVDFLTQALIFPQS